MGGFSAQVQQPQTGQSNQPMGKGGVQSSSDNSMSAPAIASNGAMPQGGYNGNVIPQPMGKGGTQTNSATSGQPRMGMQNQYSNTVGQWDNTQIQPQSRSGGKGKG